MTQKERLARILNRFVREDRDQVLEDVPFILTVIERWEKAQSEPVIDVGE